jgi:hypothetical protein
VQRQRIRVDLKTRTRDRSFMSRLIAAVCLVTAIVGGSNARGEQSPWPAHPYLSISNRTISLERFTFGSQACSRPQPPTSPQPIGGWCVVADPPPFGYIRLNQRIKAPFRGTVTVWVPDTTDSVVIGWGKQPGIEFSLRPDIVWPLPGSGTYQMAMTLKWHTELAAGTTAYVVPLYVPRQQ